MPEAALLLALLVALSLTFAVREAHRRARLNRAVHEVRRPLQALALAPGAGRRVAEPVHLAAVALERLERQINGRSTISERRAVPARALAEAALRRWRGRAAGAGATLSMRWSAGEAVVAGDRAELDGALDNLIENALAHGGRQIVLEADSFAEMLSLAVVDSGPRPSGGGRGATDAGDFFARLSGRRRHGHGLKVVRHAAANHGGAFNLHRGAAGTSAVLELPLSRSGDRT